MIHYLGTLEPSDLEILLAAKLVELRGATESGVQSYRITPAGRILLKNRWDSDNFPTQEK